MALALPLRGAASCSVPLMLKATTRSSFSYATAITVEPPLGSIGDSRLPRPAVIAPTHEEGELRKKSRACGSVGWLFLVGGRRVLPQEGLGPRYGGID